MSEREIVISISRAEAANVSAAPGFNFGRYILKKISEDPRLEGHRVKSHSFYLIPEDGSEVHVWIEPDPEYGIEQSRERGKLKATVRSFNERQKMLSAYGRGK